MGTQIIKRFLFSTIILTFFSCSIAQTNTETKDIIDAKGIALCRCFKIMNKETDSLSIINKDVSLSYFIEYSTLSISQIADIENFVEQNINSFIGIPREIEHNMIAFSCWQLYESKELDLFLKEMMKEKK